VIGVKAFGTIDGEMKTSLLRHAFVEIPPFSSKNRDDRKAF
jgi:hypothetical protein